jgi:hypothetical protein
MFKRTAFTMIELIFAIVVMGIIGKFGVEFLTQAYRSYIFANINNELQSNSETAVEIIAAHLQHRIKDSVIARTGVPPAAPVAIGSADGSNYIVLEWVGSDYEGFLGNCDTNTTPYLPNWSGIIDLDNALANATTLVSPGTNTADTNDMIQNLSYANSDINNSALFFLGANSSPETDYGWDGNLTNINNQTAALHPINSNSNSNQFVPAVGSFSGIDIYEYYKLAWSAYAVVYEAGTNNKGTLKLYWNYQPWKDRNGDGEGDQFNDAPNVQSAIIMENVSTFRFMAVGDILKIQVCTKSDLVEEYSLCKEKTIF